MASEPKVISRNGAQVLVFSDLQSLYAAALQEFFRIVRDALATRQTCNIALSGGSTPKSLYSLINRSVADQSAPKVDWTRVHFFFGDERCVPPDHPDSNYRMVAQSLLAGGVLPAGNVHRVHAELPPQEAAQKYEDELRAHFQSGGGFPQFDLILLGTGPDGHTASLFPGTAALQEQQRWVVENWVEKFQTFRITFTLPLLNCAREVMFMASGAEKQEAIRQVFAEPPEAPAGLVRPENGKLLWLLTEDAAAGLP